MNSHYDLDALLEYVEGHSTIGSEIEVHALSCPQCAAEIEHQRRIIAALHEHETWESPQKLTELAVERLTTLASIKERLDREDADAAARPTADGFSGWGDRGEAGRVAGADAQGRTPQLGLRL